MKRSKLVRASVLLLSLSTFVLGGCGSYGAMQTRGSTSAVLVSGSSGYSNIGSTTTGNTPGTGTGTGSTPPSSSGLPLYQFDIHGIGYTSQMITVQAHTVLKVKVTAGVQDRMIAGSGASPQYASLGVYVSAGNSTAHPTPLLRNGYGGTQAESYTIDLTNQFTTACTSSSDPNCRAPVTITVSQPNYDYWCINFGYGCPWVHVSDNHPWHAMLAVQTDDTQAIQ